MNITRLTAADPIKNKNKKSTSRPKRPLSAYNYFFRYERKMMVMEALEQSSEKLTPEEIDQVKKTVRERSHRRLPGMMLDFSDLTSRVSLKWKLLSHSEKLVFEKKASVDTVRYKLELAECRRVRQLMMDQHGISSLRKTAQNCSNSNKLSFSTTSSLTPEMEETPLKMLHLTSLLKPSSLKSLASTLDKDCFAVLHKLLE